MEIEIFLNFSFKLVFFQARIYLVFKYKIYKNWSDHPVVYCLTVQFMQCLIHCFSIHARNIYQFNELSAIVLSQIYSVIL